MEDYSIFGFNIVFLLYILYSLKVKLYTIMFDDTSRTVDNKYIGTKRNKK